MTIMASGTVDRIDFSKASPVSIMSTLIAERLARGWTAVEKEFAPRYNKTKSATPSAAIAPVAPHTQIVIPRD
jgi:hypothetical protein